VDEQIRQNVHKVYAGIMTDSHRKRIAIATGMLALLAVGSQFLAGQALPPSPLVMTPVLPLSPVLGTTSVQPKITWSTTSVSVILSPGESTSSDLTFTSSLPLQNAVIEAVPGLAGFLNIQPNTMPSLSAGQQQAVHIAISIPPSTPFGTYDGTIHVRVATTTFPQTMKITVNVWNSFTDVDSNVSFKYPSFSRTDQVVPVTHGKDTESVLDVQIYNPTTQQFESALGLAVYKNNTGGGLDFWFHQSIDPDGVLASSATYREE
jgi:hypothetical protein